MRVAITAKNVFFCSQSCGCKAQGHFETCACTKIIVPNSYTNSLIVFRKKEKSI